MIVGCAVYWRSRLPLGATLGGCAAHPFVRAGRLDDNPMSDVLDLTLAIQVRNSTDSAVTFLPDDLRPTVDGDDTLPRGHDPVAEIHRE